MLETSPCRRISHSSRHDGLNASLVEEPARRIGFVPFFGIRCLILLGCSCLLFLSWPKERGEAEGSFGNKAPCQGGSPIVESLFPILYQHSQLTSLTHPLVNSLCNTHNILFNNY